MCDLLLDMFCVAEGSKAPTTTVRAQQVRGNAVVNALPLNAPLHTHHCLPPSPFPLTCPVRRVCKGLRKVCNCWSLMPVQSAERLPALNGGYGKSSDESPAARTARRAHCNALMCMWCSALRVARATRRPLPSPSGALGATLTGCAAFLFGETSDEGNGACPYRLPCPRDTS